MIRRLGGFRSYLYPVAELKGVEYAAIPSSFKSNVQITNPTDDISLSTVLTDLRNSFTGADLINTYTYKRQVGITSHTAPNGYTAYYEYDPFGRLKDEKDYNQRVVKAYDYHMRTPSAAALSPWYVNIPMMQTHNLPCDLEPTDLYRVYNYMVPGGTYKSYSMESANTMAENDLEGEYNCPSSLPTCPDTVNTASIELSCSYYLFNNYPSNLAIDFIQNGTVVATQTFSFNSASPDVDGKILHLLEGEYQLSFRPSADTHYTGSFLNFTLYDMDNGNQTYLQSLDSATLVKNKHYQIFVDNF